MISLDLEEIQQKGIFYGYDYISIITIILLGIGGVLIGLVVKLTDNIIKNFAMSITIILTIFASDLIFDY
jgi:UDP-sugar transporter A1/2/3